MSTLNVDTINDRVGTGQPAISGLAKAWVNFNGTGTVAIRADYNVTDITDGGTGTYTVNFTNAMPDTNYSATLGAGNNSNSFGISIGTRNTTNVQVFTRNTNTAGLVDSDSINVAIFR